MHVTPPRDTLQQDHRPFYVTDSARLVTAPRTAEQSALLEVAFETTDSVKALLALDGTLLEANVRAQQLAAEPLDALVGRPLWEARGVRVLEGLSAWLQESCGHAAAGETSTRVSQPFHQADSERYMDLSMRLVEATPRTAAFVLLEGRDVTARVQSQHALEMRERNVRLLTDHMHELLYLVRIEAAGVYRCESVNPAYLAVTGMREDQVVGRTPEDVLPPDAAAFAIERYEAAIAAGEPITYREDVTLPTGRVVVETCLTPVRDVTGTITHLLGLARDVTAESAAETVVQAAEARFRAVAEAGLDAFVMVRAVRAADGSVSDFTVVDANTRAAKMAAVETSALSGASLLEAFPYSRDTGLWEECCTVLVTRNPLESTRFAPLPDRSDRWVQRLIVPIENGVAISSRDVTRQHTEQLALEASETRHRELFESNGAIQLLADAEDARILDVNPAAEQFYGWPRETMRSMLATDLEEISLEAWRARTGSLAVGTGERQLREHRVSSGEHRQLDTFTSLLRIAGRRAVHVIVQDVTDRVRAEAQLRESETRFRAVVSSMREGVVVHDATGAIRLCNPSAERILGLSDAQMRGLEPIDGPWLTTRGDGSPWPTDTHPAMLALQSGEVQPRTVMGVQVGELPPRWLSVSAAPLARAGDAKPYGSVAVFSDVTDEREAQERLQQAQKLEAVGQLAGGIAHDFNNLLTVIRGAAGFLGESLTADSPLLGDVRSIERATERAEELTRRLLAVGRRQLLQRVRVDLNDLLHERADALRSKELPGLSVQLELAATPVIALLDRTKLVDALNMVVENSIAAMPDGGTLTFGTAIEMRERQSAGSVKNVAEPFVVLRVTDTGVGMPEEVRQRLFEPFFSTQPFGTGRGIDLASVHGLVSQSKGFIECESEPGIGTTLRLYFPQGAPLREARVDPPRSGVVKPSRCVLVVDDDALIRDFAKRSLQKLGYPVLTAESGADALAMLAASGSVIATLVTDLTMPEMSGMELIDQVQRQWPTLPIVAISGFAVNASVRDELTARQLMFVAKPFTSSMLGDAVARAVQAR